MGNVAVIGRENFWHGRSVLITGAGGFLGSWLARSLSACGAKVIGVDIREDRWGILEAEDDAMQVQGDIRDRDLVFRLLTDHEVDVVFHLAAQAIVGVANLDPVPTFEHNVQATWELLEACRHYARLSSIVVASSDKAYGDASGVPYVEDMPLLAHHPYDVSKACADMISRTYASTFGLPIVVTRCGNLYGGGDLHWDRIVPDTIRSVIENKRPVIRSDGSPIRDYFYVQDAVAGVTALAEAVVADPTIGGQAFNLAADQAMSVLEMVDRILALMGSELEPDVRGDAPNEISTQRVNSDKARTALAWEPTHTVDMGLERAIAWYRHHLATWK